MKKAILIIGIVLIAAALVFFCLSLFFHHLGGAVMDASNDFYHKAYQRYMICRTCGIILAVSGAVCLVLRFLPIWR